MKGEDGKEKNTEICWISFVIWTFVGGKRVPFRSKSSGEMNGEPVNEPLEWDKRERKLSLAEEREATKEAESFIEKE